jgi:hypothetical protein
MRRRNRQNERESQLPRTPNTPADIGQHRQWDWNEFIPYAIIPLVLLKVGIILYIKCILEQSRGSLDSSTHRYYGVLQFSLKLLPIAAILAIVYNRQQPHRPAEQGPEESENDEYRTLRP